MQAQSGAVVHPRRLAKAAQRQPPGGGVLRVLRWILDHQRPRALRACYSVRVEPGVSLEKLATLWERLVREWNHCVFLDLPKLQAPAAAKRIRTDWACRVARCWSSDRRLLSAVWCALANQCAGAAPDSQGDHPASTRPAILVTEASAVTATRAVLGARTRSFLMWVSTRTSNFTMGVPVLGRYALGGREVPTWNSAPATSGS